MSRTVYHPLPLFRGGKNTRVHLWYRRDSRNKMSLTQGCPSIFFRTYFDGICLTLVNDSNKSKSFIIEKNFLIGVLTIKIYFWDIEDSLSNSIT